MSVSDDLNEIDRVLLASRKDEQLLRLLPLVKGRREFLADVVSDPRTRSGRRVIVTSAGHFDVPSLATYGMRTYGSIQEFRIALRAEVMLKMIRQAHDAELAEPEDPITSGIVGTPEW